MNIVSLLHKNKRVFIVPLDHPAGDDTLNLSKTGVQNFVNKIDNLDHDGYIFHSRYYPDKPVVTGKDFFLTVGETPDKYLCEINRFEKIKQVKNLTIFYEVKNETDDSAYNYYRSYVRDLKKLGYFVMAMGFPPDAAVKCDYYQQIADIAKRLGCDAFKTDYHPGIDKLNIGVMKLFVGGGPYIKDESEFEKFAGKVAALKTASFSFGRNIFESDNPQNRIKLILNKLK
jgi:DhnA family fructose-bisphosphate aldolase class Ia